MQQAALAVLGAAWLALSAATAAADYPRLEVRYGKAQAEGLDAALAELRRVAAARALPSLRPHLGETFFWEQDFGGGFNRQDSPLTNLIRALSLDDARLGPERRGAGWARFTGILRASSSRAHSKRRGIVCAPADPVFADKAAMQRAFRATGTQDDLFQWGFVEEREISVRSGGEAGAPVIAGLRSEAVFVREWGEEWAEVELPDGRAGFVRSADLRSASPERLCFGRDKVGAWKIIGYMGGGD